MLSTSTKVTLLGFGLVAAVGFVLSYKDIVASRGRHEESYAKRKKRPPVKSETLEEGANCIYDALDHLIELDAVEPYYFNHSSPGWNEGNCGLQGIWVVGSIAAQKYTKESDIDYWLHVNCLTEDGKENLDDRLKEEVQDCNPGNRSIDIYVSNRAPPKWMPKQRW